jgi:tetratricopeptide (TPR) repeat protein
MYQKALKYDSTFAPAYTGLAGIYWSKNYYNEYFSVNFLDSVLILANKALYFDNKLPEAYYIRGMYYSERGINARAIEEFDKTIQYNPNYWPAYFGKGNIYSLDADLVNAIENGQKAASFYHGSGLSEVLRSISSSFGMAGFFELANTYNINALKLESDSIKYYLSLSVFENNIQKSIDFLQKAYSIDSTDITTIAFLGFNYSLLTGQLKESMKFCKKYLKILKAHGITIVNNIHRIGYVYWKNGIKDSADYYFNKQIEICNNAIRLGRPYGIFMAYYDLAGIYAFKGNKIMAYQNLKIFNQIRKASSMWVWYLKHDPLFDNIRDETEFQQIVKDVEAKYQAEHEKVRKWLEENGML